MLKDYSIIIRKAKKLSQLIKNSEISIKYNKSLSEIRNDRKSQLLLEKLIFIGSNLNNKIRKGETPLVDQSREMEIIKEELENNELVKRHINNQKEYLDLIRQVLQRIKDPQDE